MKDSTRYITDAAGKRLAVILPLEEYEKILAELGMTAAEFESSEPSRAGADLAAESLAAEETDL
jgi:hypothetical protein